MLDQNGHVGGIFSGVSGSAFPFGLVLLPAARIGDQPVAVLAGKPHRFPAVCRGQERDQLRRRVIELGFDIVVFSLVRDALAAPQAADDLDRLDQTFPALGPFWPDTGAGFLVQHLPRADPEKHPSRIEQAHRCERLGDDGRIVAQCRTGHSRADPCGVCSLPKHSEGNPGVTAMSFVGLPKLRMVARRQKIEAGMRGPIADPKQFGYRELLVRQHVTNHSLVL
jgi:hypothetical protein